VNKKKFKNVLVVLGGTSGERAVSLESGKACIKALKKKVIKFFHLILNLKILI
jgi:D-alanine-D-alanine ligase-like ATP-grasp enzyme